MFKQNKENVQLGVRGSTIRQAKTQADAATTPTTTQEVSDT